MDPILIFISIVIAFLILAIIIELFTSKRKRFLVVAIGVVLAILAGVFFLS